MSKLTWLRSLLVPVLILSILLIAFVSYYLYWVPNRQRHLDDRGFRYLKTLNDQIRLRINTYDKMLDNAVDSGGVTESSGRVSTSSLEQYLGIVDPELVVPDEGEAQNAIGHDYADPPKIAVRADEGTHFLYLAFSHYPKGKGKGAQPAHIVVRTDLDKLIDGLLGSPDLSPFDVVLVAQSSGKVIFQKSQSGLEVARIKNLEDASGEVNGKTDGKTVQQIDMEWLSPASRLEQVKIAGARYRLYSQPLQIGFFPANPAINNATQNPKGRSARESPTEKSVKGVSPPKTVQEGSEVNDANPNPGAKNAQDSPGPWVLCGLVRADRFRSESQLIPYSYILTILAAILLAATAYPFLRLYLSSPGERLRAKDVAITAVFACLAAGALTFILTDIYYWNSFFGPAANRDMQRLAHAINLNFEQEKSDAFAQLDALDKLPQVNDAINGVSASLGPDPEANVHLLYGESAKKCDPPLACRVNILDNNNPTSSLIRTYPYEFFISWSDSDGRQLVKWTTRKLPTPFVPLDDPSIPYYPDVKRALKYQGSPSTALTHGIGSQYSGTTGQNITVFWKIIPSDGQEAEKVKEGEDENKEKFCASLVTQPISLYNSILPAGYQFAVLTPEGVVVFHSDPTRNLRENFFAETDQNPDLRSRVRMRAAGPVVADYLGRPHRMYVQPMAAANQDGPWTIVVFRDLHREETMNLEILSLVSTLFFVYTGVIAFVLVSVCWFRRDHATRIWLWPDSRKAGRYKWIAIANGVAVALVLLLSLWISPLVLLLCASVIPAAVLVLNLVILAGQNDLPEPADQPGGTTSTRWQSAYFGATATLLVAVALLPCFCFFKVVANFEHKLFLEHTQLQLAADLEKRARSMQSLYQEVSLGNYKAEVLAGPEGQHAGRVLAANHDPAPPVFSYHESLETSVCSKHALLHDFTIPSAAPIPDCRTAQLQADKQSFSSENSFLSGISLSYNERAADERHLAEDNSDEWKWTLIPFGRSRILRLISQGPGEDDRIIASFWTPFQLPRDSWSWWLGTLVFLALLYWLVRLSLSRIFLLDLVTPPPARDFAFGVSPASLMADLPMNLLIIGPEACRPIASLIHRSDVQVHETEELLGAVAQAKSADGTEDSKSVDKIEAIIRDGRPLVLRSFERLPDDVESAAKANAALMRVLSALGNSVIILSDLDPQSIPSIEASDRWRLLLRSFVRIDLNSKPGQRIDEDDADYQNRVSIESYCRWLISGLSKPKKLILVQLAQENVVNPNSSDIVSELMEQGLIERRWGLLKVKDKGFAKFLKHAIRHHTVKQWEKELAGTRPFSLQTSLLIVGAGVVAFLVYTQGDVFNTWVTYATGLAASVPKVLQLFDSFRTRSGASA